MHRCIRAAFAAALLACFGAASAPSAALAQTDRGYFRQPALHGEQLVFVAEGDLWRVGAAGGVAQRLTTHDGAESLPAISPDGRMVAFVGTYEGPAELYVMPLAGGLPKRLTWDGGGVFSVGWSSDGRVLYGTRRRSTLPNVQLHAIDVATGERTPIPLAQAADGALDANTLYFTRLPFQGSHAKNYKGGMAQQIWKWSFAGEAVPLTSDYAGASKFPSVWNGRVYFLSDRDGTMNLWSMLPDGKDARQHTKQSGWDVVDYALHDGRAVYRVGADLRLLDLRSGADRALDVRLASDFDHMREKWITKPMEWATSFALSPTGDRVAITARGQVFVAPAGAGRLVEATRRDGVRYRNATWMPDGRELVVLSDESGEVELWTLRANGVGAAKQLTRDGEILRWNAVPAPDGKRIAHTDKNNRLWIYDAASGRSRQVAESGYGSIQVLAWSPDSRWLAFNRAAPNSFYRIELLEVESGRIVPVTTDRYDSYSAAWSPDGKWLWFLSDRNLVSWVQSPWGARQPEPYFPNQTKIYGVALRAGERFPFQPADELQGMQSSNTESTENTEKRNPSNEKKNSVSSASSVINKTQVRIDEPNLSERLYEVPVPPGDYSNLTTDGKRLYFLAREPGPGNDADLKSIEISNNRPKAENVIEDVRLYELSDDRKKLMVRKGDEIYVFAAGAKAPSALADSRVDLSGWTFALDPREEWRQMFTEAWRLHRDYFWDPGMNAVDWDAMRAKYAPLAARVTDRAELNDVIAQLVSELSTLHTAVFGGDQRSGSDEVQPASLGAVTRRDRDAGGHVVVHVYRTDPDLPGELSPLARPGVDVRAGDVILSINGQPTAGHADLGALLRAKAGKQVLLSVKRGGSSPRDVVVTPISMSAEADLRYDEWEYTRRLAVDSLSVGRIGYVHLRNMAPPSLTEWYREYYPVANREALIVDVRNNTGGNTESFFLEKLMRRPWMWWQPRVGEPYPNMQYAFNGPMAMLVNERSSSDGELIAEGFRRLGLGKVIGTRTWGGEIWLTSSNVLVDRGIATAAEFGVYGPEGEWLIEGHGVDPDIVVDNLPAATYNGRDAQLERAVAELLRSLRENPVSVPPRPRYRGERQR